MFRKWSAWACWKWLIMAVNSTYVLPGAGGLTFKLRQR